jgi:hypothetical protein
MIAGRVGVRACECLFKICVDLRGKHPSSGWNLGGTLNALCAIGTGPEIVGYPPAALCGFHYLPQMIGNPIHLVLEASVQSMMVNKALFM